MRCPHLREARLKYCGVAGSKKLIVQTPRQADVEKCSSPDWKSCTLALQRAHDAPALPACPHLQESPAQYCAAASVTKYLPPADASHSPCESENYRYCDYFLQPEHPEAGARERRSERAELRVEGIRVSQDIAFSPNHMWLDVGAGGSCHVGVDDFFARLLGLPENLSFVSTADVCNPTVVFTVHGIDLQMVFPGRILVRRHNTHLRPHLEKLAGDPYGIGWLFEGTIPEGDAMGALEIGLIPGSRCGEWMKEEVARLAAVMHRRSLGLPGRDPGHGYEGLIRRLNREEVLLLFNEFFSPHAKWIH